MMATSSKVRFNLETLRAKALESLDLRIDQAQRDVKSFEDDEALNQRIAEWRARQEEKIANIFRQLGDGGVDNHRLAQFVLDPIPEVNVWDRRDAAKRLEILTAKRSRMIAKSESLVPDADGGISLTKTQLQEFFAL